MDVDSHLQHVYDHFDSSSSSGGSDNHSSPSAQSDTASAYSATSHPEWALDLGLSIPALVGSSASAWNDAGTAAIGAGVRGVSRRGPYALGGAGQHLHDGSLALTGDFWSAAPVAAAMVAPSPPTNRHFGSPLQQPAQLVKMEDDDGDGGASLGHHSKGSFEMEFDDMVHEDLCGPATVSSPNGTATLPTPISGPPLHIATYHHISIPSTASSSSSVPPPFLAASGLSIPLPHQPSFPAAGIAPSLTGGQPTPSLGSPVLSSLAQQPQPEAMGGGSAGMSTRSTRERSTSSRAASLSGSVNGRRSATHSASSSRERNAPVPPPTAAPSFSTVASASSSKAPSMTGALPGGSLNLVARDAILAASLIPSLSAPPPTSLTVPSSSSSTSYSPRAKLLVLGVPTVGAKSRVETQIKISLALVRPRPNAVKREDDEGEWAEDILTDDGSLVPARAANELERVGSWSHVRLPKFLALKSKAKGAQGAAGMTNGAAGEAGKGVPAKKASKPDPPAESTLTLDVAVVRASDPSSQIFICQNCRQRELKRSLRKKDPKGKTFTAPLPPAEEMPEKDEEEEKRKVVVFNAPEFVEFATGECIIPTRVTCYCRHHKEKKGFCITYTLRDHLDNIVATGMSPPIMITDDHKTNTGKAAPAPAANGTIDLPVASASSTKRKAPAKAPKKEKKEKAVSASSSSAARPRRGAASRSRRGQSESDEELEASAAAAAGAALKKPKPYDADSRPRKRMSTASHRSPTFAMTPLHAPPTPTLGSGTSSTVASPAVSAITLEQQSVASPSMTSGMFSSSLGLGGMGDAVMVDSLAPSPAASSAYFSPRQSLSAETSLPSLQHSHNALDWRANGGAHSSMSTPPLSPGSAPSVSDTFNALFGSFPSPNPSIVDTAPVSSIPSFAIPATEPMPPSLTSAWAFQQQLQQHQQGLAASAPAIPPPRISRLIPAEGPVHGGIEVTVLGENFVRDLTCVFGDSAAVPTHFWSANTLVCVLPPSANPGPVVVGIKGVPLTVEQGTGLQLFTYKDDSDRSLLELALQVVGLKMTGRLEDASAVAMRIVGSGPAGAGAGTNSAGPSRAGSAGAGATDTATLAATLNAAASSVYATPAASRAASRRGSTSGPNSPAIPSTLPLPAVPGGESRNFEGIVIKFLSLLDLDPSLIPGAAPSLPSASPPISQQNAQQHTLLHLATVLGFHRLVAFLLAAGIDLDLADRNGFTALHFAALYGRVAISRLLLEAGANARARNLAGRTPLEIARERDDVDVEELLLRAAGAGAEQATPALPVRRQLVAFSPPARSYRSASLREYESEEEEEEEESTEEYDEERKEEYSYSEQSDWSVSEEEEDEDEDAGEDYSSEGEEVANSPRSRELSRNASTVSLHYLLEAELAAKAERPSPRSRKVSLPAEDDIPGATPVPQPHVAPFDRFASASSSWFSQKLKPTVQPGLDKLQPIAGVWEKAKANRFTFPQMQMPNMHIPEITAFHAMPAAITRRMSNNNRAGPPRPRSGTTASAGEETDAGDESASERSYRDWRSIYSGHWWHSKTPSSPPPQYSPTDALRVLPPAEKSPVATATAVASTSSQVTVASQQPQRVRTRRRKLSNASDDTDDAASVAASDYEEHRQAGGDRMLWFFWIPVLLFVLCFAYANWSIYLTPVLETLAETILPRQIGRLIA
ncbi:hypothetical protein JCM5296_006805 [Sporobolomyces johnsonii]